MTGTDPAPSQPAPSAPHVPSPRDLARRVRASRQLSGSQKKYWLSVLPHLHDADRARLDAILRGEDSPTASADTPA